MSILFNNNNLWNNDEIIIYFSLFGANPQVLQQLKTRSLNQTEMNNMSLQDLVDMGMSSRSVCDFMLTKWKEVCHKNAEEVLEELEQEMVSVELFTYLLL